MAGILKVQGFRANDLSRDSGKQVEFGKTWCEDFFGIGKEFNSYVVTLFFKPLTIAQQAIKDKEIELKFGDVTNRGDRKAYANDSSGYSQIKNLFINELHLTEDNLGDYFAIYKTSLNEFYLFYIPNLLYDNFITLFKDIEVSSSLSHNAADRYIYTPTQPLQQIYRPYLTAIKSKPFLLLAGISGTGKSRIVRELARACWDEGTEEYNAQKPQNFEMIQVKPNWHDSTELVGLCEPCEREADICCGGFLAIHHQGMGEYRCTSLLMPG